MSLKDELWLVIDAPYVLLRVWPLKKETWGPEGNAQTVATICVEIPCMKDIGSMYPERFDHLCILGFVLSVVFRLCWTFHPNSVYHSVMVLYLQEEHVSCQCTFGSRLHGESEKVNSLCECSKGSFLTWYWSTRRSRVR